MLLIVYFDPFADFFSYFLEGFEIIRRGFLLQLLLVYLGSNLVVIGKDL